MVRDALFAGVETDHVIAVLGQVLGDGAAEIAKPDDGKGALLVLVTRG